MTSLGHNPGPTTTCAGELCPAELTSDGNGLQAHRNDGSATADSSLESALPNDYFPGARQSPSKKQSHSPPQQRQSSPQVPARLGITPGGSHQNEVMTSVTPVTSGSGAGQMSRKGSMGLGSQPDAQAIDQPLTKSEPWLENSRGPSDGTKPLERQDPVSGASPNSASSKPHCPPPNSDPRDQKNSKSILNCNTNCNLDPSNCRCDTSSNRAKSQAKVATRAETPSKGMESLMVTTMMDCNQNRESDLDLCPSQTYLDPRAEEVKDKEDSTPLDDTAHKPGKENPKGEETITEDLCYGWGSFRPACLQFLNKPVWVVFFLCLAIVAESMATVGLVSITISTLETRFQLSSNQAGLIPSAYQCAGLPALIISGYFGGNGHRPRWIACGMFLLSLGSLLYALPHFLTGPYTVDQGVVESGMENICTSNQSVSAYDPCLTSHGTEDLSHYLYVFMAGHTLHGIGGVPLYTLSLTYIDDIAPRGTASIYIGVILSLTTLGPAIAFVGAGYLLELYTDLDVIDISKLSFTSSDPRWVGAWWICFLITFTLALITVIPLAGFPHDMPGAAEHRKKRITEVHDTGDNLTGMAPGVGIKAHDFPRAVSVLVRNPTFMFLTLVGSFELFFLAGFGTFSPKYMENMFNVTPATAGIITGLLGVPGGAAGSILASVLIKRLKMTSTQMLKWMFLLTVVIVFLNVIFLVQCDNIPFAGVNVPYSDSTDVISLMDSCNTQCACSEFAYEPVCGSNNVFYFSPCHAGCQLVNSTGQYADCACIPSIGNATSTAHADSCSVSCNLLPVYSVLFFMGIMLAYLTAMFHLLALIRVVPDEQRSFAVSIDWFMSRLLGGILGPVVFGSMLDLTCVLWERKCDGSGSCLYYENGTMGWYIFCMATACLVACVFSSFMAWWKYKPPPTAVHSSPQEEVQVASEAKTVSTEMNGVYTVNHVV